MQSLFLTDQTIVKAGWVLVHFLWQGLAAAAVMWVILKLLAKASSTMRYAVACAGLCLMTAAPVVTFVLMNAEPVNTIERAALPDVPAIYYERSSETQAVAVTETPAVQRSLKLILLDRLEASLPYCVFGWLAGVLALSLWYLGGWCQLQKLRLIGTKEVCERITAEMCRMAERLQVRKAVHIAESALVQVPTAIGWLKPMILLPASALTGLDELQLRAMVAHELAHIKRCDYLVNMLQTVVEILLFYHPAVWWISKQIRTERENCCDDTAAELVQDRTEYAKALFTMEEIRVKQLTLALGAAGGSLNQRIRRLIVKSECNKPKCGWMPAAITFGLILAIVSGIAFTGQSPEQSPRQRVLHFPADRSLGIVKIQNVGTSKKIMAFHHWVEATDWWNYDWAYLAEAKGDVTIPADKRAALFVNESGWQDLSPLSALASDDLYMLTFSTAEDRPRDPCMQHIAGLTGLRVLNLGFTDVGTDGLAHIAGLQNLEYLTMPERTTNKGLSYAAKLTRLKGLYMGQNTLTDAGLQLLASLKSLEELELGGSRLTDDAMVHLAGLPRLTYLMLQERFSDAGMEHLKNIRSLKILNLARLPITDIGLSHLAELDGLENLSLQDTAITDAGLAHLKKMRSLKKLDLGGTEVTAQGFAHLAEIKSLEYLDLPGESVTDSGLTYLSQLTNLRHLNMPGPHYNDPSKDKWLYTDAGLAQLVKLHSLEELMLSGAAITDAGMDPVSKLTHLKRLTLFGCPITNNGLARLATLKSLESLDIYESKVTIGGLAQLNGLTNLENLAVKPALRDGATLDISGLEKLAMLTINTPHNSDDNIVDADLACLANLKNLRWLQIPRIAAKPRALTDAGMAHLRGLTNMDRLTVGGPGLTDKTLTYLKDMKKLDMLNVSGGSFTDEGLSCLQDLKSLQYIRLEGKHQFTQDAVERLRGQLPNLLLFETGSNAAPAQRNSRSMSQSPDAGPNESERIISAAMMGAPGGETVKDSLTENQTGGGQTAEPNAIESMEALRQLGLAYFRFVDDHGKGVLPPSIQTLKPYLDEHTYSRLAADAVLLWTDAYPEEQSISYSPLAYDRTFLQTYGRRIVVFMDGHVEAGVSDGLKQTLDMAIRYSNMSRLKHLGVELMVWENEHNEAFPASLEQLDDSNVKNWALQNVKYLAGGKRLSEIKQHMEEILAYDLSLLKTHGGTNVLYADGHIEFHSIDELRNILPQEFPAAGMPGMGGFGVAPAVPQVDPTQPVAVRPITNKATMPLEVRNIYESLANCFNAVIERDYTRYEKYLSEHMKDGSGPSSFEYLQELMQLNPKWTLNLLSVHWDDDAALAITDKLKSDSQADESQILVFTLEKQNKSWLLWDIDLEEIDGLQIENSRFITEHPNANTWYIEPAPQNEQPVAKSSPIMMGGGMGAFGGGVMPPTISTAPVNAQIIAQDAGMILGTVVDSKGNPAAGALVLAMPHGGDPVVTDAEGKFGIAGPPQDPAVDRRIDFLLVRNPQTNEAAVAYVDSLASPARIQLEAAVTVTGFVKDSSGRPIGGADVYPSVLNGWEAYFGNTQFNLTNMDGHFEIIALPQELEYSIHVKTHGFRTHDERLGRFSGPGRIEIDPIVLAETEQIAIEARFILAPDALKSKMGLEQEKVSGQVTEGLANSELIINAMKFKPLNEQDLQTEAFFTIDDTQRDFLMQETQKWKSTSQLSAPKAVVLNNESAHLQVKTIARYYDADGSIRDVEPGLQLQVLPSIQDSRNVLLRVNALSTDIPDYRTQEIDGKKFEIPWVQVSDIRFQTLVESGKTIVVVGPQLTNPSFITEPRSLFVLLKPTVIAPEKEE